MARITGIGGVFFRSSDPHRILDWYADVLGLPIDANGSAVLRCVEPASAVLAPFPRETDYFGARTQGYMINLRVDDLDGALAAVRAAGGTVDSRTEESEYGRFGWIVDPDGNRVELWEPAAGW
jgi:predicted enzyme related to lactoylglutathione lyase